MIDKDEVLIKKVEYQRMQESVDRLRGLIVKALNIKTKMQPISIKELEIYVHEFDVRNDIKIEELNDENQKLGQQLESAVAVRDQRWQMVKDKDNKIFELKKELAEQEKEIKRLRDVVVRDTNELKLTKKGMKLNNLAMDEMQRELDNYRKLEKACREWWEEHKDDTFCMNAMDYQEYEEPPKFIKILLILRG